MIARSALVAWCLLLGCKEPSPAGVKEAEFGVFFGGQLQELKQIQKELDPARQKYGFRLTFAEPLVRDAKVDWEISLPGGDKGGPRPAMVGETKVKAGEGRLDVPLSFRPSDPLGDWHAKVMVDGRVVIDRDFAVVAAEPPPRSSPRPLPPRVPSGSAPP
jgi:Domain of unknown function (DUF3859)